MIPITSVRNFEDPLKSNYLIFNPLKENHLSTHSVLFTQTQVNIADILNKNQFISDFGIMSYTYSNPDYVSYDGPRRNSDNRHHDSVFLMQPLWYHPDDSTNFSQQY
jgi:ribosomal protein S8